MRLAGLLLVLLGVIGVALGIGAMLGIPFLFHGGSVGDSRAPGAGPLLGGILLVCTGLAIARSRARA